MTYKEVGFRAVYHRFCVVRANKSIKQVMKGMPGEKELNAVLTYGYYDREAGVTLEILAAAMISDKDGFRYLKVPDDVTLKLRIESVQ